MKTVIIFSNVLVAWIDWSKEVKGTLTGNVIITNIFSSKIFYVTYQDFLRTLLDVAIGMIKSFVFSLDVDKLKMLDSAK